MDSVQGWPSIMTEMKRLESKMISLFIEKVTIPKVGPFFMGSEVLEQERKNDHDSTIFWAKNKVRGNFI